MKRTFIHIVTLAGLLAGGGIAVAEETNSITATNSAPALDYKSFQIISQRNIFNPGRSGRKPAASKTAKPPKVDSFTLVGTMSYEKGRFAFFDGSGAEYRKTLKPADTIAGYKIAEIAADYVKLGAVSNQTIRLPVGSQMKREEGGFWVLAGRVEPSISSSNAAASGDKATEAAPGGIETDAMRTAKRMMLKRLSEK